jgi:hypothetical protein
MIDEVMGTTVDAESTEAVTRPRMETSVGGRTVT